MLKIEDIRRWNARVLADRAGGVARFAEQIGRAQAQVSHIIGKNPSKAIERGLADHIEAACEVAPGWLDAPHVRDWLGIQSAPWAALLRVELARAGVSVDQSPALNSKESELLTAYNLMSARDRGRLLAIARVLLDGTSDPQ